MVRTAVVVTLAMFLVGRAAIAAPAPGPGSGADAGSSSSGAAPAGNPSPDHAAGGGNGSDGGAITAHVEAPPPPDHKVASAIGLAGTYATLGGWAWYAWYYNKPTLPKWKFGGDGWLGPTTYAGGADKFGHFWANLTFSRLGTDLLRKGGWGKVSSSLIASSLTLTFFFFVEVKDGFYYEFSPSDMTGNTVGALLAVAMSNWPALDDALDVRVQWFPSREFQRKPSADFAEDYTGETYLFAFKPRSIRAVREGDWSVKWLEFVNPVIGFDSRNYKPTPAAADMTTRKQ